MPPTRRDLLSVLKPGDVIFGVAAGGQEKLLLVTAADPTTFRARHVTSQTEVEFDRDGRSRYVEGGGSCTIVSTAALSPQDHATAIGLDRKMRTGKDYPDFVLSPAEIQLILSYAAFFRARPLPD